MPTSASKNLALSLIAPAPAAKVAQKPAANGKISGADTSSKQSRVVAMLQASGGVTIAGMMKATGWQKHSVRGAMSGQLKTKYGFQIQQIATKDKETVYQIAG